MRHPAVPWFEAVAGGVWWIVGASALSPGPGTAVLAAGLGATAALLVAARRRFAAGAPLPPGGRTRLLRLVIAAVVLIAIASTLLGLASYEELSVPLACAIVGLALFPLASLLDERALVAAGAVLLVLGAVGSLLALDSAGLFYPQGLVGLLAGSALWVAGAHRLGLLAEARNGARR